MSLTFLPGKPNDTQQSICQGYWQNHTIFTYCSGNNLIILSNQYTRLQTIYLEEDCVAVDINQENGFVAIAVGNSTHIYKPIHQVMKNPKWSVCCKIYHDASSVNCVKWGSDNELVIGSDYLSFWKVKDDFGKYNPILLWNKRQSKPVYYVNMTDNSQFIASFGKYDHTVKLWKRISISGEQVIFNLSLLSHPAPVTMMRWKKNSKVVTNSDSVSLSSSRSYTLDESYTLYTLCEDKTLRIWICFETENTQMTVQNWGSLTLNNNQRYCLIIDSWIIQEVIARNKHKKDLQQYRYFIDKSPDVVLLGGIDGTFDTFALENLSTNPPKPMIKKQLIARQLTHPVFVTNPDYLYFAELQPYDNSKSKVSLVIQDLQGVIRHSLINIPNFLDQDIQNPSTNEFIIHLNHKFTGHNKSIQRLARSSDGEALVTISRFSENCIWTPQSIGHGNGATLLLKNIIKTEKPIKLSVVHEKGNLVICLLENFKLQVWECPPDPKKNGKKSVLKHSQQLDECYDKTACIYPLLMVNTPEPKHSHERHFVAIVYSDGSIKAFEVSTQRGIFEVTSDSLHFNNFSPEDPLQQISTIDPVHTSFFSDRPLLSLITKKGVVEIYKAYVSYKDSKITWKMTTKINTGMENARFVRGSSTEKLCLVSSDGKTLTFWDLERGVLEYEETFVEEIQDIDWTSTHMGQGIVSIGFTGYALLYTELRYDYTNNTPSYLPIEKIDITSHTAHNIGDSIWMKDGIFVVASGNQLYVKDKTLDLADPFTHRSIGSRKILSNDILHLNSVLTGPLPVYHPQFLIQAIYATKIKLVKELLLRLFLNLRNIDFEGKDITTDLPSDLGIDNYKFFIDKNTDYPIELFPDPYPNFDKTVARALTDMLTKFALPYVTRHQQITLITVIEAMEEIVKNENVLDHNAVRFLLGVKLFHSHQKTQKHLLMRDVSWALHSENKSLLLSMFDTQITSWEKAKEYKIAYWIKQDPLMKKFEEIAKYEYSKDGTRDPARCAVFYLALKKKQILLSLWKISVGHPEQQKMIKFLNNDFTQPRWRTAALKNAFALMSKHRYLDAATFFLLGGSLKDSANVLCKQQDDIDLAIGVCRVYEGDNGPVLGELLSRQLLPTAVLNSDKWATSYIYWKLRKQDIAIQALVTAPIDLENNVELVPKAKLVNKSFLVEDPALLFLYRHLRTRNINYFLGSLELGLKIEYNLIVRSIDILCRMGCNYLAAALVKNWVFINKFKPNPITIESPKKIASTKINILESEPTSNSRVRPSLFDKFSGGDSEESKSSGSGISSGGSNIQHPPNLLDGFAAPPNMLDSFGAPPTPSTKSNTPKNMLDNFTTNSNPKSLLDSFGGIDNTPPVSASGSTISDPSLVSKSKPKSLLDNFSDPIPKTKKSEPKRSKAPKNLLDDFM